jgi:DNA polymerase-3 subunit gamma/tau
MDVIEIDAASHGGVEDTRDLRERAFFAPVSSRFKIYIIDEAHMVSPQGFNALLKLVEEPPPHLKFIFATTEPEKVIGTIKSRTHHYPFRLIPPRTLSSYLAVICDQEGVKIDPAALPLVVRAGGGSARDTLSVLDQLIGGSDDDGVTYQLTTSLLGFTPDTLLDEIIDAFAAQDGRSVFGVVDKVIESGQDPRRFTEDLLRRLRDLVVIASVPDASASGLIDVPEDQAARLTAQAARFGRADLVRSADTVAEALTELKGATAPRLLLELLCARVLLPGADHTTEGVLARLDRIERRLDFAGSSAPEPQPVSAAPAPAHPRPTATPDPPKEPAPVPEAPAAEAPAAGTPDPETPAASAAAGPAAPAGDVPAPDQPGGLSVTDLRRLWPDVIALAKERKRVTWMLLSHGSQVVSVDDTVLTLGFHERGARDMFLSSGHDEVVRQLLIDRIGRDYAVEAVVAPGQAADAPPAPAVQAPAPATRQAPSAAVAEAREAMTASADPGEAETGDPDADVSPDDPEEESLGGAELIQQTLGGTVIEEISHD